MDDEWDGGEEVGGEEEEEESSSSSPPPCFCKANFRFDATPPRGNTRAIIQQHRRKQFNKP